MKPWYSILILEKLHKNRLLLYRIAKLNRELVEYHDKNNRY
jgi:hypothetical protein